MSEEKGAIKSKFTEAMEIGSDPNIPVKDAVSMVWGGVKADYAAAKNYNVARAERKKAVADRLQQTRKECGLKQQEVAEKTGINVITLSGYEIGRNEPNMEALVRLADVYGVTLDYLMCRTDN